MEQLEKIQGLSEELLGILLLEYHNKNHLHYSTNPKRLNEEQREIVENILWEIAQFRKRTVNDEIAA